MGFWGDFYRDEYENKKDENKKGEKKKRIEKQHLNLSTYAMSVVQEDSVRFGVSKLSTFINRVFKNFYPDAEASIIQHTESEKKRLTRYFDSDSISAKAQEDFIRLYLDDFQNARKRQIQAYPKGVGIKFRINNENYEYLLDESDEDQFYGECHVGVYLKAVLEEYARKPYIERERIFFKDFLGEINRAIEKGYCLLVSSGQKIFKVSAFAVEQDSSGNYHYLIGKSVPVGSAPDTAPADCSFRLSRIKGVEKREAEKSWFSNDEARAQFQKAVDKKGVQFMLGDDSQEIVVKFTEKGVAMYNSMQYLRPSYTEKNDKVYKFDCTTTQAEFYFFKFGKEVTIIEPTELAKKFRDGYHEAHKNYL